MVDSTKDAETGRNPAGEMLTFAIDAELARARSQPQWSSGDRVAHSLVKHRDLTVTALLLRKGAHLREHHAPGSIAVQVLSGAIRFTAAGSANTLTPGMVCVLDREVPHAVEALEESAILLTASLPS